MLGPKASYVSRYARFSKRDRKSQASKSIFSNSTNHLLVKVFLSPVTTTVTRLNQQSHLSRFIMNKRTLLLTPPGYSSHGIFSDSSGNDPLPLSQGEGQEWSTGHSNVGRLWDLIHPSRETKNMLLFMSSPKMRPENLCVVSLQLKGEEPREIMSAGSPSVEILSPPG